MKEGEHAREMFVVLSGRATIEIEGGSKPACVAESVLRYIGG